MATHLTIDLNCDIGEGMPDDHNLIPLISSANIACGFHAGNADIMQSTAARCLEHGVAVGAHPGFDDRENFGRREIHFPDYETYFDLVCRQVSLLQETVSRLGGKLSHVKPHGALYNMSARDPHLAAAIAEAVKSIHPELKLYGLAGSCSVEAALKAGLPAVSEFFADRTYQPDGSLTPRNLPNALISDDDAAIRQALNIARHATVTTASGEDIRLNISVPFTPASICLHGDGSHALNFARKIRAALQKDGIRIAAPFSG